METGVAFATFEEDAKKYIAQDFPSQDVRIVWDHPDKIEKLPVGLSILSYTKLNPQRVEFKLEGQEKTLCARIETLVEVPTLNSPLSKNSLIQENDIVMLKIPLSSLTEDVVLKTSDLLGKAPKHKIQAPHIPLHLNDLIAPTVVKRGEIMNISYQSPHMHILTKGKAMKDGKMGEKITLELINKDQKDKKTVEVTILSHDTAIIKVTGDML